MGKNNNHQKIMQQILEVLTAVVNSTGYQTHRSVIYCPVNRGSYHRHSRCANRASRSTTRRSSASMRASARPARVESNTNKRLVSSLQARKMAILPVTAARHWSIVRRENSSSEFRAQRSNMFVSFVISRRHSG